MPGHPRQARTGAGHDNLMDRTVFNEQKTTRINESFSHFI